MYFLRSFHLTSWGLISYIKPVLRSYIDGRKLNSAQRQVVQQLLSSSSNTLSVTAQEPELLLAARELYGAGLILPDIISGSEHVFRFSSPLHGMLTAHDLYTGRNPARNIDEMVRGLLLRMGPQVLQNSKGRTKSTSNPLEGSYHHEVYRAMFSLLPETAVLSVCVGKVSVSFHCVLHSMSLAQLQAIISWKDVICITIYISASHTLRYTG